MRLQKRCNFYQKFSNEAKPPATIHHKPRRRHMVQGNAAGEILSAPGALPQQGYEYKCLPRGMIKPSSKAEKIFNEFNRRMLVVSGVLIGLLAFPICFDIIARTFFGFAVDGIIEIESLALVPIAFTAIGFITINRQHLQIDLFYDFFSPRNKCRMQFFAVLICLCSSVLLTYETFNTALHHTELTPFLFLPEKWFIFITTFGFACSAISFGFQLTHIAKDIVGSKDYAGMIGAIVIFLCVLSLPFIYKASGVKFSGLLIGGIVFLVLFSMLMARIPIGFAMALAGMLGLICLKRTPAIALATIGDVPYMHTASFVLLAVPMFMLMGELVFYSGISTDLFECANRWLGRLPGGLAAATVGGCAGFGAVCGESLPTVITMSAVALPAMRAHNYDPGLSTGVLAAGGTLGILIPPSIGFIFYSIITEESVGKLFIAGIFPGLLLSTMFIITIVIQVKLNPALAPKSKTYSFKEKISSLVLLLPMVALFVLVVGGILAGSFTPGEGGAVGAMGAFIYAICRRKMNYKVLKDSIYATVIMSGKIFMIFAGVYSFGAFLSASRLPIVLANTVISFDVNRYVILVIVICMYIVLGSIMNIMPMLLLTLPSIFPTIQALGFDGIWFGVITVMLMEMGMITPPIGIIVFTLSGLCPDIPMVTIFKGVLPFVLAMMFTIFLIILFPQIALFLPNALM